MHSARFLALFLLLNIHGLGGTLNAQERSGNMSACGPLNPPGQYGPYDFRTDKDKLPVVVDHHFSPSVEYLIGGQTSIGPGGDIAFTLRAIPNHPNALMAMMKLGEREKANQPSGSTYTVECWFDRAIRFRPDDHIVRMIYVSYLTKQNRKDEARKQLEVIAKDVTDNPFTHNNIGLLYFDLEAYDQALKQAHIAIGLGLTRPELRDKLQSVGKWHEQSDNPSGTAKK